MGDVWRQSSRISRKEEAENRDILEAEFDRTRVRAVQLFVANVHERKRSSSVSSWSMQGLHFPLEWPIRKPSCLCNFHG